MRITLIKYCALGLLLSSCSWADPQIRTPQIRTDEFRNLNMVPLRLKPPPPLPHPVGSEEAHRLSRKFVVPGSPQHPDWYNEKLRNAVILPTGYIWTSANKTAVKWIPGLPVKKYPHVVTAEQEGYWIGEPGYDWVTKPTRDFKTVWSPGVIYDPFPIMASNVEGFFVPIPGYMWTEGEPFNQRPDPVKPIRKKFENFQGQFSIGDAAAAATFVKAAGEFFDAAHRGAEMALFKVDCIRTERRERLEREAKAKERGPAPDPGGGHHRDTPAGFRPGDKSPSSSDRHIR